MTIIDISRDILKAEVYPGDPTPKVDVLSFIGPDSECNMSLVTTTMHAGTHVDAPLHFLEDDTPIIGVPLDNFIGECCVITVPEGPITGEMAERIMPINCERLLIRSGGKAYFTTDGAQAAAACRLKLIGTDSQSIGVKNAQTGPHKAFLGCGVSILEGLDLSNAPDGRYFLMAQPLKIGEVEASLVRALLIKDQIFWSTSAL